MTAADRDEQPQTPAEALGLFAGRFNEAVSRVFEQMNRGAARARAEAANPAVQAERASRRRCAAAIAEQRAIGLAAIRDHAAQVRRDLGLNTQENR